MTSPHTLLFYKPYGVLSQFRQPHGTAVHRWATLSDYGPFPPDVYPAGRLDADSEGLLLLTNDPGLRHLLTGPHTRHPRTYLVQVERVPDPQALRRLKDGTIVLDGRRVRPARARLIEAEPDLPARPVPIRERRNIPTSWLELTLTEGRNRQVRRMTAAAGYPTLRLVRVAIGGLTLQGLAPGQWRTALPGEVDALRRSLQDGIAAGVRSRLRRRRQ